MAAYFIALFLFASKKKSMLGSWQPRRLFGLSSSSFAAWIRIVFFAELLPMPHI